MKKILSLIATINITLICLAQGDTISLDQAAIFMRDSSSLPEYVSQVKDINNHLEKFVGTWKGTYGNKTYEIQLIKFVGVGDEIKWDELMGNLLIKNLNGNITYNTTNCNYENMSFSGRYFGIKKNSNIILPNFYIMYFVGRNVWCNDMGYVSLSINTTTTPHRIALNFTNDTGFLENCPNPTTFEFTIPARKQDFYLYKQ